jgi:transposase
MESIVPKPASDPLLAPTSTPASPTPAGDPRAREARAREDDASLLVASHEPRPPKTRRSFTVEQKRAIVLEASRCSQPGDVAALLRKHGLYASTLGKWRKALAAGAELRGAGRPRVRDEKDREIAELRRRVEALDARARRAESLVDLQKKAISLLDAMASLGTT